MRNVAWELGDVKKFIQWLYIGVNLSFRGRSGEVREGKEKCEMNFIIESVMTSIPVQRQEQ